MFDRFGAPRVDDDDFMSTKQHQLIQRALVDTGTISDLYNNSSDIDNSRSSDTRTGPNQTTTPPPSPRRESQAYATTERSEQKITTITTATTAKQISENIRTIAELAFEGCQEQLQQHHNHLQQQLEQQHQSLPGTPLREAPPTAATSQAEPSSAPPPPSSTYQLRALTGNKIEDEEEEEGKEKRHCLNQRLSADSLSLKLIEETLTYFISCKQRLSQITKTFDDSNALIMLLQEKEEDLEVVGQLGQDLLRRYNELKEAYEGQRQELARFQEELSRCREDNQQLKYDLASNRSLLDTFKEEEEHLLDQANTSAGLRVCSQCQADEEGQTFSLRSQADRSLTYLENELYKQMCELKDELMEVRERELNQKLQEQERNLQLEMQLRDNERRQTDLEGENENLRDQQRELQQVIETQSRRFDELLAIFSEYQREARAQYLNNGGTGGNTNNISFGYLTESSPSFESQLDSLLFLHQPNHVQYQDTQHNQQQQQPLPSTPISPTQHQNQQIVRPIVRKSSSSNLVTSTSLHEELLESMQKTRAFEESDDDDDDSDQNDGVNGQIVRECEEHDGADSGLHTRNISTSTTPVNSAGTSCLDTDSDDAAATITNNSGSTKSAATSSLTDPNNNTGSTSDAAENNLSKRLSCLGLSTFTLTTLLLLCLSATFNSTTNSNLAQRLQQINLNQ